MDQAVFVADLDRLPPPDGRYDRLYLGSEFCQWRLPGPRELDRAQREARERGMAFSLVTPFLTESGLRRVASLVRDLPADGETEVVANDLGLLEAVAGAGWRGTLVAGRLLTRQRRGPGFQDPVGATPDALAALQGSALDSPSFVDWLGAAYGVRRFELDDLVPSIIARDGDAQLPLDLRRPDLASRGGLSAALPGAGAAAGTGGGRTRSPAGRVRAVPAGGRGARGLESGGRPGGVAAGHSGLKAPPSAGDR